MQSSRQYKTYMTSFTSQPPLLISLKIVVSVILRRLQATFFVYKNQAVFFN